MKLNFSHPKRIEIVDGERREVFYWADKVEIHCDFYEEETLEDEKILHVRKKKT